MIIRGSSCRYYVPADPLLNKRRFHKEAAFFYGTVDLACALNMPWSIYVALFKLHQLKYAADIKRYNYSAVRHIWRTKVRCSTLYLLHNFHLKSIPI
jgi:hypothetical protein